MISRKLPNDMTWWEITCARNKTSVDASAAVNRWSTIVRTCAFPLETFLKIFKIFKIKSIPPGHIFENSPWAHFWKSQKVSAHLLSRTNMTRHTGLHHLIKAHYIYVNRVWHFSFKTSRFRNFSIFFMVSVSEIFGIEKSIGMYVKIGQWYAFNFCWKMLFCLYSCNDFSGEKTHCSRSLRLLCESHSSVRAVAPRLIAGAQSAWNRSELQWRYECMVSISIFSCIRASVWSFLLIATWYDVAVLVDVGVKITVDTVQVELRLPTTEFNTFEFLSNHFQNQSHNYI